MSATPIRLAARSTLTSAAAKSGVGAYMSCSDTMGTIGSADTVMVGSMLAADMRARRLPRPVDLTGDGGRSDAITGARARLPRRRCAAVVLRLGPPGIDHTAAASVIMRAAISGAYSTAPDGPSSWPRTWWRRAT